MPVLGPESRNQYYNEVEIHEKHCAHAEREERTQAMKIAKPEVTRFVWQNLLGLCMSLRVLSLSGKSKQDSKGVGGYGGQ